MKRRYTFLTMAFVLGIAVTGTASKSAYADPSKYPDFAQQKLPDNIKPTFIKVDQLVDEVKKKRKPVIIDVRTAEEFKEAHILGSVNAPLAEFTDYVDSIPKDRLVVLY